MCLFMWIKWINRIISKLANAISKFLFLLGSYKFLAYLECIRSYAWSFGHSDLNLSSVKFYSNNAHYETIIFNSLSVLVTLQSRCTATIESLQGFVQCLKVYLLQYLLEMIPAVISLSTKGNQTKFISQTLILALGKPWTQYLLLRRQ